MDVSCMLMMLSVVLVIGVACDGTDPQGSDSAAQITADQQVKPTLNCQSSQLLDLMVCEDDKDCVFAQADCCGCRSGGTSHTINQKCQGQHKKSFHKCPNPHTTCKAVDRCAPKISCVNWHCAAQYK